MQKLNDSFVGIEMKQDVVVRKSLKCREEYIQDQMSD